MVNEDICVAEDGLSVRMPSVRMWSVLKETARMKDRERERDTIMNHDEAPMVA